jgi:hypothetical protein
VTTFVTARQIFIELVHKIEMIGTTACAVTYRMRPGTFIIAGRYIVLAMIA